jgi:Domain of Unknown Function (DUF349)
MPRLHLNRSAGTRRGVTYVGVSQRSSEGLERSQKRARRDKKKLISEAEFLAQSTDWKSAGEKLTNLHRRWKAAGSAGPDHEERMWKQFKAATDEFHRRRIEHFAELDRLSEGKAVVKEQLIAQAEQLSSISDYKIAKAQFSDLMGRWRETGHAGNHEDGLWERFAAARQAMYEATEEDRRSLQSEYLQRVEERIHHHREVIGKLRSLRRELTLRRQSVMPGWVGMEMMEEFDERIEGIDESITTREGWLEQDVHRLDEARGRL